MRIGWVVILGSMFLLCYAGTIANAVISPDKYPLTPEVTIVQAEFGLFYHLQSGERVFVPGRIVPYHENQGYGWVILLDTKKPKIRWREEFTLPAAPALWDSPVSQGGHFISEDKRVSIMEQEVEPDNGLIYHNWAVVPGDPKGRYIIRVIVENRLEEVFEFDVQ
jgi:hypothetical protein